MTSQDKDEALAENGDPAAQLRVGVSYLDQGERQQDFKKALSYLRKSAIQGNIEAQYHMGLVHKQGKGVEANPTIALKWFYIAAEAGHKQAISLTQNGETGMLPKPTNTAKNLSKYFSDAVMLYKASVVKNKPDWQFKLGCLFEAGLGVDQDYAEAAHWYKLASDQKHDAAHAALGKLHFHGLGVANSTAQAVDLFTISAANGNADGQYHLGYAYEMGIGVEKNVEEAHQLYSLAAEKEHKLALLRLGLMFRTGIDIKPKVSQTGMASKKKYGLASKYEEAREPEKEWHSQDFEKSHQYFKRSADKGNPDAQYYLGTFYAQGLGIAQDFSAAVKYFRLAVAQGHPEAMSNLAFLYAHGQGLLADYLKAAMWYEVSRRLGYKTIEKNLEFVLSKMTNEEAQEAKALAARCIAENYQGYD